MAKKRQTARQKVMELVELYGATIVSEDSFEIEIEAPAGHVWSDSELHSLLATRPTREGRVRLLEVLRAEFEPDTKDDLWLDLAERMASGVKLCEDPECEWCHGEPGDDEEAVTE